MLDNQKAIKNTFQAPTFKVEENSRTFQGLAQKFKDFSWKNRRTFHDYVNPVLGCCSKISSYLIGLSLRGGARDFPRLLRMWPPATFIGK